MDDLKLVIGGILGFIFGILLYPTVVHLLPEALKVQTEVVQTEVVQTEVFQSNIDEPIQTDSLKVVPSKVRRVTIKGNYADEVNYKIIIQFQTIGEHDKDDVFIDIVNFITSASKGIDYAENGERFKELCIEYITKILEAEGIKVIKVSYNLTE